MRQVRGTALTLATMLAIAGCTETQFSDTLGVGKSSPDEGQVRINQALSMPPDLQLSPPSKATSEESGQPNKVVAQKPIKPVTAAPADADVAASDEPVMTASTAPTETIETEAAQPVKTAEAATAAKTTATEAPAPPTIDDAYQRYGISKTYADGKPKPQGVLNEELRKAEAAAKRAANPGYGTIWNMGDMFSDD